MTLFIGFAGKKTAGKDTAASILKEIVEEVLPNKTVVHTAFANPLKRMCRDILGVPWVVDPKDKDNLTHLKWENTHSEIRAKYNKTGPMTIREVWQVWGTEYGRYWDPDIWVKIPFRNPSNDIVILSDARFPNECDAILNHGGLVYLVQRGENSQDIHPSEVSLDYYTQFTGIIDNNSTLEDLEQKLLQLFNREIRCKLNS